MTGPAAVKLCEVVYACPQWQFTAAVKVPQAATVADVLERARLSAGGADVPWLSQNVGIFGERCGRDAIPRDGDRVEIYRPLEADPRERRRDAVSRARRAGSAG